MTTRIFIVPVLLLLHSISFGQQRYRIEVKSLWAFPERFFVHDSEYDHLLPGARPKWGAELGVLRDIGLKSEKIRLAHGVKVGFMGSELRWVLADDFFPATIANNDFIDYILSKDHLYGGYKFHLDYQLLKLNHNPLYLSIQPSVLYGYKRLGFDLVDSYVLLNGIGGPSVQVFHQERFHNEEHRIFGDVTLGLDYDFDIWGMETSLGVFGILSYKKGLQTNITLFGENENITANSFLRHQALGISLKMAITNRRLK